MKNNPIGRALGNYGYCGNCSGDVVKAAYQQLERYQNTENILQQLKGLVDLIYCEGIYTCPFCGGYSFKREDFTHLVNCPFDEVKELLDGLPTLPD